MSIPPIIIIAEPDPIISSVLRVEFTHLDFAVLLADSGPVAEAFAAHTVAHLIVLDAKLYLGAYDACARIRRRPGYAKRPIVLTTNDPSPRIRAAAETAGATVVLAKPYSVDDLFGAVRPFIPPGDLLLTHRGHGGDMAERREWGPMPPPVPRSGGNSALTRNGQLLPIVRRQGVAVPIYRKP
jgi:twitching motility two-component system response regulator PilG